MSWSNGLAEWIEGDTAYLSVAFSWRLIDAYQRAVAQKVIEWGGEPYVQPLLPLNALDRDALKIAYDWTWQQLKDFQRYYNRHLWRYVPLDEYSDRQRQKPVFQGIIVPR